MEPIIIAENLVKEFKISRKEPGLKGTIKALFSNEKEIKKAVDGVSFSVCKGEIVGYIGKNGAGKSTTIKMLTGILIPTRGRCVVNGIEPYQCRQQNAQNIGVVFGQRTQLWWNLPLIESFTVLKNIYQVSDRDYKDRMEFINNILEIGGFQNVPVRALSLGQRMRADVAAALIHNPKILYLDEPTIGLDVLVKNKIRTAIKELNREFKTTIILTTHDMTDIEELCEHIIIIEKGKIIYNDILANLLKIGSLSEVVKNIFTNGELEHES